MYALSGLSLPRAAVFPSRIPYPFFPSGPSLTACERAPTIRSMNPKGKSRLSLRDDVQYIKGVGPARAKILARAGIREAHDLLTYFPRKYIDRSVITMVGMLVEGRVASFQGRVIEAVARNLGPRRSMFTATVADDTGEVLLTWFNAPYLADKVAEGCVIFGTGKVGSYKGRRQIVAPEIEILGEEFLKDPTEQPILPVYPAIESISTRVFRRILAHAVERYCPLLRDVLWEELKIKRDLIARSQAVCWMHFPPDVERLETARRTLAYEELFLMQLALAVRRSSLRRPGGAPVITLTERIDARIRKRLPFKLTDAQERALARISRDMASDRAMNRLLEGDVGSGKTIVAVYAILNAVANKFQAAFMAPTEVLAEQHYATLSRLLAASRVNTVLLVGAQSNARARANRKALESGEAHVAVGTHALIQEAVKFHNLGLMVVDEQHKFGVLQRRSLKEKGRHPHCLVMTATPIPRTLALTVFGDLDVSILDELPPGRSPVGTRRATGRERRRVFKLLRSQLDEGRRAYIVYPLVEESEALDLKSAQKAYEELRRGELAGYSVGLIHGRLKLEQKERAMDDFRTGRIQVLVATVVIEVGLDVPEATVMIIEHAERFGLAQLHQLRGRVGRGAFPGQCILFAGRLTDEARARIDVMVKTTDGFVIAEEDLRLRGPGEFFGTRQTGLCELRIANLARDMKMLETAREDAFSIARKDPRLEKPQFLPARKKMLALYADRLDLGHVG